MAGTMGAAGGSRGGEALTSFPSSLFCMCSDLVSSQLLSHNLHFLWFDGNSMFHCACCACCDSARNHVCTSSYCACALVCVHAWESQSFVWHAVILLVCLCVHGVCCKYASVCACCDSCVCSCMHDGWMAD
jgi:hypothetical protein